jgi:hypothetical protein
MSGKGRRENADSALLIDREIELNVATAVAITPKHESARRGETNRHQKYISLNLVFALGSTTNSGGVKVVQCVVSLLASAEQL